MTENTWKSCVHVITRFQQIPTIQHRFYVAGGLVPWLVGNRDSGRLHGDIDIVVANQDMHHFRKVMQHIGCYNPATDSQVVWSNKAHDYGFDVTVDDVTVNIAPFEHDTRGIIQRNATYSEFRGVHHPVTLLIPELELDEYVMHSLWYNQLPLGHYPLALVYATKQITKRDKDRHDCAEIERLGVSFVDVARYLQILQRMEPLDG
ncbi:MAG: hypothetical protein ACO3F2_06655 [Roseiflexaceae bacterium]